MAQRILRNGRLPSHYESFSYFRNYPNNKITKFLTGYPVINRRSVLLDPYLFKKIPEPQFVKVGIVQRNDAKQKNERILTMRIE